MGADEALELLKLLLWRALEVGGPVLAAALCVGLLISVVQVATQLQEMTLSYVPKLLITGLVLVALGPWMLHLVTSFATDIFKLLPSLG